MALSMRANTASILSLIKQSSFKNRKLNKTMNNQETAELAFNEFQRALNHNLISLDKCEVHKDLFMHFDQPQGQTRYTYALMATGTRIKASCVVMPGDEYKGKICFDVGVATFKKFRKQGHATAVLTKAIDELKNGLKPQRNQRVLHRA
ncbi:hypothetical protein JCM19241_3091 [Vibrio ishigakensis]|uniref:Uncharacterized protein n=1 Tax=Vibrio ishigakensis TaxID=1481914 RepID=A0A0B8Q528_9VIBR|nr:hypothetical protein JCM19241_3091 [Vibrio ishigakensis]